MPADRFFIDSPLNPSSLDLSGTEFHHLAHVMRLRPGQKLELVNGQGAFAEAEVLAIHRDHAELKILSHTTSLPPPHSLILSLAMTRPSALEWTVEKATELGVTHLWIFPGEKSDKPTLSPSQESRLRTILVSALKQCGRLFLPTLDIRPPLSEWTPPTGSLFFGDLSPQAPHLKGPFSDPVIFFMGPEKGFSPAELEILTHTFHAQGISLHENTLRAETAALSALSQYHLLRTTDGVKNSL